MGAKRGKKERDRHQEQINIFMLFKHFGDDPTTAIIFKCAV